MVGRDRMFRVLPETAKCLYRAQFPHLRGRLRLDICSRDFPADPALPLDLGCAVGAIGERLVGLLVGCSCDFPHNDKNLVLVMPSPEKFEDSVVRRIDRDFGLDEFSTAHSQALSCLARDFYGWVVGRPQVSENWFEQSDGKVFVRYKPYTDEELGIQGLKVEEAEDFFIPPRETRKSAHPGNRGPESRGS